MPPKKEDNACGKCSKSVKEGIQCDICDGWWHPACAGLDSELCEHLGKNQQMHWYCARCNSSVGKLIKEVMRMNERLDMVEDCVRKVEDKMEKMREGFSTQLDKVTSEVNKNRNEVRELIQEEMKKCEDKVIDKVNETKPKWSELVTQEVDIRFNELHVDIDSVHKTVTETKEKIMDNEDKLKRIKNIIMYNVQESKSETVSERNKDDMNFCGLIMDRVLKVGYEEGDIIKVVRLGRFDDTKKRPLLIEFSNAHVKNVVMENVTKLGSARNEFTGVTVSHDMTIKEREQCRDLVEEAKNKQKTESGNYIYRVRGLPGQMKIVRFRTSETVVKKV